MTAEATIVVPSVMAILTVISSKVTALVTQTSTSILRSLRQGRSSLSAIPGDNSFLKGDAAVFA